MSDDEWARMMLDEDNKRMLIDEAEDEQEYEAMLAAAPWNNGEYDWYSDFIEDGEY